MFGDNFLLSYIALEFCGTVLQETEMIFSVMTKELCRSLFFNMQLLKMDLERSHLDAFLTRLP